MIKRETFEIMKEISYLYDNFVFDQEKVNLWHEVLKNYPFKAVQENLFSHAAASPEPPTLFHLVAKIKNAGTIPNSEETKGILQNSIVPASPETIQKSLAKMREILGINRGEHDVRL